MSRGSRRSARLKSSNRSEPSANTPPLGAAANQLKKCQRLFQSKTLAGSFRQRKRAGGRRGGEAASRAKEARGQSQSTTLSGAANAEGEPAAASGAGRTDGRKLFEIDAPLIECTHLRRPSSRNRAPYVADISLPCGREAIGHFPSLDLGGKCVPGSTVYVSPARDGRGRLVGPDAVSPKYGTPKCEFICRLVRNLEPENAPGGCLIGAHPRLGEMAAAALLKEGEIFEPLSPLRIVSVRREVTNIAGCDMRLDFLVDFEGGSFAAVEVKTVVDTDYSPETAPVLTVQEAKRRCMFVGPPGRLYRRAAIFPWGMRTQPLDSSKGSTKVVSARAIRHVRELTRIATGDAKDSSYPDLFAAVMFVVARSDAVCFRVNGKACPEFAKAARAAHDLGVRLLAPQVSFELDADGRCSAVYRGQLPIEWPAEDQVGDCP